MTHTTTVLVAGDDVEAKQSLIDASSPAGCRAIDAGPLKRARELEAVGLLQMTLAAGREDRLDRRLRRRALTTPAIPRKEEEP